MIKASLKNYRISPRKIRVVANLIRGKKVLLAGDILRNTDKKAKSPLGELLSSAVANAKNNFQLEAENLYVKEIRVDQGYVLKRYNPVSRGSAHPIKKRTSHVSIVLAPKEEKKEEKKVVNKKIKKAKK